MSSSLRLVTGALAMLSVTALPARAVTYCSVFNTSTLEPILDGVDPCGFYTEPFSDAVEACGDETFIVAGPPGSTVDCDFCFWAETGAFENEFGVVALDDIPFAPGDPGFRMAALTAPSNQVIFAGAGPGNEEPGISRVIVLDANRTYIFWLVQNSTRDLAIADPFIDVFFSIAAANDDGMVDHLKFFASAANGGATAFAWEDLTFGGDMNYSDLVFTSTCAFATADCVPQPRSACIWPPNHRYRCFGAEELVAGFVDSTGAPCPPSDVVIVGASSSQPEDAIGSGDGRTGDDVLWDADVVCVRAERQGGDPDGRDYEVMLAAADTPAAAAAVAVIHVPHDQREERRCESYEGGTGLLPHEPLPLSAMASEGTYP